MKICFVVRSIYSQHLTYTTTHLAYEAHKRGHEVVYTTINSFSAKHDLSIRATVISPGDKPFGSSLEFLRFLQSGLAEKSEVILSFLGFGVPVGVVSWGSMLNEAQSELLLGKWWQLVAASVAMAVLVTAFSMFTDALRDALDPKLK